MSEIRRLLLEYEVEEAGRRARNDPRMRKALIDAFSDVSETVRERALIAAMELEDPSVVLDAVKALEDDDANVRVAAAQVLAWYRQPRVIPALIKGLKDSSPWVRSHCAAGLSNLLKGPIWARLKAEDLDKFSNNFDGMTDAEIDMFLNKIGMRQEAKARFLKWRSSKFEIEIDMTQFLQEIEGKPIILDSSKLMSRRPVAEKVEPGISPQVEEILSRLPPDIRAALPEEDIRRLTPETAAELVESLTQSFKRSAEGPAEETPSREVTKVRKVKVVKRVKKTPTREELIMRIPEEVKATVPRETLDKLSIEELEALLSTPTEERAERSEMSRDSHSRDPYIAELTAKYGDEKARVLATLPVHLVHDLPEEQIRNMDLEQLREVVNALKHE
ncbi:MAG: HEAT repeat domain-containing protein [Candidatus Thorarchaeota archaeon]